MFFDENIEDDNLTEKSLHCQSLGVEEEHQTTFVSSLTSIDGLGVTPEGASRDADEEEMTARDH